MPQDIISQFDRKFNFPIETDRSLTTLTARNAIDPSTRWEGMMVYVEQDEKNYFLKGGILNTDWQEFELPDNAVLHLGNYDVSTNTPLLTDISGSLGQSYKITGAATETNVDFGSGDIPLTNNDFILHDGSNWIKYIDNNQGGGSGVVLLPSIVENSTDGVQSGAIYDETQFLRRSITRSNLVDKFNNFYGLATMKGIGTVVTDFSTLTYDRGVIFCRDNTNSYMIVRNVDAMTGTLNSVFQTEVFNDDGRKFWWSLIFDLTIPSVLPLKQSRTYGFLTNNPVTLTGVPATYTSYIFETDNLPFDFDANVSGESVVNVSLVSSPSGGGSTITVDSVITDGSTNPTEGNAIYDTIKNDNAQGLQNGIFAQASIKGIEAPVFGLGAITYDRDIILARTLGGANLIVKDTVAGLDEFRSELGSRWRCTIFQRKTDNSGMGILQNIYSNELRSSTGEVVGIPSDYTAFVFSNTNWFASDFDIPIADNAFSTFSLTFSASVNTESRDIIASTTITGDGTFTTPTITQAFERKTYNTVHAYVSTLITLDGSTTALTVNLPLISAYTTAVSVIIDGVVYPGLFSGGGSDINITGLTGVNVTNGLLTVTAHYEEGAAED